MILTRKLLSAETYSQKKRADDEKVSALPIGALPCIGMISLKEFEEEFSEKFGDHITTYHFDSVSAIFS